MRRVFMKLSPACAARPAATSAAVATAATVIVRSRVVCVRVSERASDGMLGTIQGITAINNKVAATCTTTAVCVTRRQRKSTVIGTPQTNKSTIMNFKIAMTLFK